MENSSSQDFKRLEDHFKYVKSQYGFDMAFYRYKTIRASFEPTLEELERMCLLLGNSSIK
jgi:hypothetical protein